MLTSLVSPVLSYESPLVFCLVFQVSPGLQQLSTVRVLQSSRVPRYL